MQTVDGHADVLRLFADQRLRAHVAAGAARVGQNRVVDVQRGESCAGLRAGLADDRRNVDLARREARGSPNRRRRHCCSTTGLLEITSPPATVAESCGAGRSDREARLL